MTSNYIFSSHVTKKNQIFNVKLYKTEESSKFSYLRSFDLSAGTAGEQSKHLLTNKYNHETSPVHYSH